jgi:type 1 glutamine amidotransferase
MRPLLVAAVCLGSACHSPTASVDVGPDAAPALPPHVQAVYDAHCDGQAGAPRVLVFSAENLWSHPSNPVAAQTLLGMCATRGYTVTATHDPSAFYEQLPKTDVVVFAVTSGPVMSDEAKAVFEPWARNGGGVVGIHAASATDLEWPFFVELMGGQFAGHGPTQSDSTVHIDDPSHPTMAGMTAPTLHQLDEWYAFVQHPEATAGITVEMSLDEATLPADYPSQILMGYHAITWSHERLGGRVFYTAFGHMPDTYSEPWFLDMLGRAIDWTAAGHTAASAAAIQH